MLVSVRTMYFKDWYFQRADLFMSKNVHSTGLYPAVAYLYLPLLSIWYCNMLSASYSSTMHSRTSREPSTLYIHISNSPILLFSVSGRFWLSSCQCKQDLKRFRFITLILIFRADSRYILFLNESHTGHRHGSVLPWISGSSQLGWRWRVATRFLIFHWSPSPWQDAGGL